ncbi:MAG TPA: ATP-binding protein [Spirochaetota bacterium]|nr:ATP-binding protein [Spirochaetota bacterium]HNT12872.1 ATP-binding protein [Spirochaetota bacterium]
MYIRKINSALRKRLSESRRYIQILAGPRQVGKTTLITQTLSSMSATSRYVSADDSSAVSGTWIEQQWHAARAALSMKPSRGGIILAIDEIQKVPGWSETVKRLWDEDTRAGTIIKVVLLGSSPLLIQKGLTESLAGRFEMIRLPHWSFAEMRDAFGFTLDQFIYHGAYPGAAPLIGDEIRWRHYIRDSLIETSISRDILMMVRIDKPALLKRLFELGCVYSGQILSYNKILGQLTDAGNTTTLAHYLELLGHSGLLTGLQKFSKKKVVERSSSPKFLALNTALVSAQSGDDFNTARLDPRRWGRLVESAIGAHLANSAAGSDFQVTYWRERNREVDFILSRESTSIAIEVKSGLEKNALPGIDAFAKMFSPKKIYRVGSGGIPIEEFLVMNPADLL